MTHYHCQESTEFDIATVKTCLTVCAHPDDAEYYAGGLIKQLSDRGVQIHAVYATSGDKGNWALLQKSIQEETHKRYLPSEMGPIREREIPVSNKALGISSFEVYRFLDSDLFDNRSALVEKICKTIRTIKPDLVLSFDPWKKYELHADHRVISFACLDALLAAENNNFYLDQLDAGLKPHKAPHVLLYHTDAPNYVVPLSPDNLQAKINALQQYASQYLDPTTISKEVQSEAEKIAKRVDKACALAEEFHYIPSL